MLSATDKVKYLLSTLDEARTDWEAGSGGDGVSLMPSMYHRGSYRELERALAQVRDTQRQLWWHACSRYRWGWEHWVWVTYERHNKNPRYNLPPCTVLRGTADHEAHRARVLVYEWTGDVVPALAEQGIDAIKAAMHDGEDWRIDLPPQAFTPSGAVLTYAP